MQSAFTHPMAIEFTQRSARPNFLALRVKACAEAYHPDAGFAASNLNGSLDYVATGLPKAGDIIDGRRFVDRASPWSFSLVFVLPVAPI
jgi:hypothetical protein